MGVALAATDSFFGEDERTDSADHWDAAYDGLTEAHDEVSHQLRQWLPSVQRAAKHVVRTFYERTMKAIADEGLTTHEWRAWVQEETQALAEVRAEYEDLMEE